MDRQTIDGQTDGYMKTERWIDRQTMNGQTDRLTDESRLMDVQTDSLNIPTHDCFYYASLQFCSGVLEGKE